MMLSNQSEEARSLLRFVGLHRQRARLHLGFREFMSLRRAAANVAAFARLVHLLRRQRQEVLHSFLLLSYPLAALVARAAVPVLAADRRSLGDFKQHRPLLLGVKRLATRATDLLIAHAVAEDTLRREHVPARKIAVIHNGLPDEAFAPRPPARIDTERPVLLCIANLKLRKGHRDLLEAVGLLQAAGQPCRLVPAGDGDRQDALAGQARKVGTNVRFLGAQPNVGPLLTRTDVVILPSLRESVSNAFMEVPAAGRPIVTSAVGGTPELLRGRGGPVPPVDPAALGSAVRGLLAEPIREGGLGTVARQSSHAHLSADAMVEEHIRIYNELLGRRCAA